CVRGRRLAPNFDYW
nr:immunoglobulin heavy chain junction region [Macaca mulatta]